MLVMGAKQTTSTSQLINTVEKFLDYFSQLKVCSYEYVYNEPVTSHYIFAKPRKSWGMTKEVRVRIT